MSTRLYFRTFAYAGGGTMPSGEQSSLTADYTATNGFTLKRMHSLKGTSQTSHAGTSVATASAQSGLYGVFITNRCAEDQNIGGGGQTLTVNIAMQESNTLMNMGAGLTANVYVWRPSTGAIVGTVCANLALTGAAEPTAGSERSLQGTNASTTLVAALFADVLICEIWQTHTQGDAVARTGTFYYDGATVTTSNDTAVSDHASFLDFSSDSLSLENGFAAGDLNSTLGALTLSAAATSHLPGDVALTAAASVTWGGANATAGTIASGAVQQTATASVTWAGATIAGATWAPASIAVLTWTGAIIAKSAAQVTAQARATWDATPATSNVARDGWRTVADRNRRQLEYNNEVVMAFVKSYMEAM